MQRICCRRMITCHPQEVEDFMVSQKLEDTVDEQMNYTLYMIMKNTRTVNTD